jgi:hypothetical protein
MFVMNESEAKLLQPCLPMTLNYINTYVKTLLKKGYPPRARNDITSKQQKTYPHIHKVGIHTSFIASNQAILYIALFHQSQSSKIQYSYSYK